MSFRGVILVLALCNLVLSQVESHSSKCNRSCKHSFFEEVPYPFGFSKGCPILLNCSSDGTVRIGDFPVMNFTSETILVSVPVNCNRSIRTLQQLNGRNFAIDWRNIIQLRNCTQPLSECMLAGSLSFREFGSMRACDMENSSLSCYWEFMDIEQLKMRNCSIVISSFSVKVDSGAREVPAMSLNFQTLELGWWLVGKCSCHGDAKCVTVKLPNGGHGHRCKCNRGFVGDGFADGHGCREAGSDCNLQRIIHGQCGVKAVRILAGVLLSGACAMAIFALLYCCIRRCYQSLKEQTPAMQFLPEASGGYTVPFIPYREIKRGTNGFSKKQMIGSGAYSTVYGAELNHFGQVAIKKLTHEANNLEQVMNEIKIISSVHHPNLVQLLGYCIENEAQILVYEFLPNGTLSQHLHGVRGSGLSWRTRLAIATETAHAIAHLHSAIDPPVYHRDIKSSNILLDLNCNSKLADFGLSRLGKTDDSHISTMPQGTLGYLDPQYHQNYRLSDKTDVYSFGVVLAEIITAKKVVDLSRPPSEINLATLVVDRIGKGLLDEIIDPFLEPHMDVWTLSSIHRVAELAFTCLAFEKDMRPSMVEVADELEQITHIDWATEEGNLSNVSSAVSSHSSLINETEKPMDTLSNKGMLGSRRLFFPQRLNSTLSTAEVKGDSSPVSVQAPWLSAQSSSSPTHLLGNVAQEI